jgi:hypothetical protein
MKSRKTRYYSSSRLPTLFPIPEHSIWVSFAKSPSPFRNHSTASLNYSGTKANQTEINSLRCLRTPNITELSLDAIQPNTHTKKTAMSRQPKSSKRFFHKHRLKQEKKTDIILLDIKEKILQLQRITPANLIKINRNILPQPYLMKL